MPKVNPGIADFEKKVKVLNELRREAGLKFLTLADIKSKPSVVYETNDRLLEIRDRINWQKSRLDLVLVKCEQIKFKKRLEAAFRKQQQEAMQQAAAGTGPNTSAENTVSER